MVRNLTGIDAAVLVGLYRAGNDHRDEDPVTNDRPDRSRRVRVPRDGAATARRRDFDGGSIVWSAWPASGGLEMCSRGIELACPAGTPEIAVAREDCAVRWAAYQYRIESRTIQSSSRAPTSRGALTSSRGWRSVPSISRGTSCSV